jgi:hypothetical protein
VALRGTMAWDCISQLAAMLGHVLGMALGKEDKN